MGQGCDVPIAYSFTVPSQTDYRLAEIDFALISLRPFSTLDTSTISLFTDICGLPGTLVDSMVITIPAVHQLLSYPLSIASFSDAPELTANSTYWIAVLAPYNDIWFVDPSSRDMGYAAQRYGNGPWTLASDPITGVPVQGLKPGFTVIGIPEGVPEPASLWLSLTGLAAVLALCTALRKLSI